MKLFSDKQATQKANSPVSNSTVSSTFVEEGRRHLPKKKRSAYYISVDGVSVPVSEEVYDTYHYYKRKEKTWEEKDARNGVVSYDAMDSDGMNGEEAFSDPVRIEDVVINNVLIEQLHLHMAKLSDEDQELLYTIFYEGLSEDAYSKRCGIPQRTIHDRKVRAIMKLRKLFGKK